MPNRSLVLFPSHEKDDDDDSIFDAFIPDQNRSTILEEMWYQLHDYVLTRTSFSLQSLEA